MAKKSHSPQVLPSPSLPASESFDQLPASVEDEQHTPMMPTVQCCSLCFSPTSTDTASSDTAPHEALGTTAPNTDISKPRPDETCTHADPALIPAPLVLHGGRDASHELSLPVPVIQINGEPVEEEGEDKKDEGKGKAKIPTGQPVARHDDWLRKMERALYAKAGI